LRNRTSVSEARAPPPDGQAEHEQDLRSTRTDKKKIDVACSSLKSTLDIRTVRGRMERSSLLAAEPAEGVQEELPVEHHVEILVLGEPAVP
jgi:hypothetical protein